MQLQAHVSSPRSTQCLNGQWNFLKDQDQRGKREKWWKREVFEAQLSEQSSSRTTTIQVPSCWEIDHQDYEGIAFYGLKFEAKALAKGEMAFLQFGAVNYLAQVWLNDVCLGQHEGGYGPFDFRVDGVLVEGENFLSVRVLSPIVGTDQEIDGLGKNDMPHWRGAIAGGIWQGVQLLTCHEAAIEDIQVIPHFSSDEVELVVNAHNGTMAAQKVLAKIDIRSKGSDEKVADLELEVCLAPGSHAFQGRLKMNGSIPWSLEDPHLYLARVSLQSGSETVDVSEVSFGMRELSLSESGPTFNGKPIVIKAAFFEALYPEGLAHPDSEEMARREIQLAKDAGFNMIRPWRKPPAPMWLDLCDEMGMMVVGGLPIECMDQWPTVTPQLRDRVMGEIKSAITRDRNRACIVQWEIFNEIWRTELKRMKHEASVLARALDPSRLILDESGGFADGANLYLPHSLQPVSFNDVHIYPGAPLSQRSVEHQFLALSKTEEEVKAMGLDPEVAKNPHATPGKLTFVSEIGYGSLPDLVDNNEKFAALGRETTPAHRYHRMLQDSFEASIKAAGMQSIYPSVKEFCLEQQQRHGEGNRDMIQAIRCNDQTCGYAVHALTDGDWVLGAGLLDLFRQPKTPYHYVKAANAARIICVRAKKRNVYAQEGAEITITGVNDLDELKGSLKVLVLDDEGVEKWSLEEPAVLGHGVSDLLNQVLDTSSLEGSFTIKARFTAEGMDSIGNQFELNVFGDHFGVSSARPLAVIDPEEKYSSHFKGWGYDVVPFEASLSVSIPVVVCDVSDKVDKALFKDLEAFVNKGGRAAYMEVFQRPQDSSWVAELLDEDILPVKAKKQHGLGLWVGVTHAVKAHPFFDGLPVEQSMGSMYENIWSPFGLRNVEGDHIVAAISHGFYADNTIEQHHQGPEPAWHSMDMGIVEHGRGQYILSALRLMHNLGVDPVADKITSNMLKWLTK